jgi:hypothetical protein
MSTPLPNYARERELAAAKGVHQRTLARPRKAGLIRFLYWSNEVWSHVGDVDKYIESRVQGRNRPRRNRSHQQATA